MLQMVAAVLSWICMLPYTRRPMLAATVCLTSVITHLSHQLMLALARLATGMVAERSRRRLAASASAPPSTAVQVCIISSLAMSL